MIRHPSENFIKYLMTQQRPEALEDSWITGTVESLEFPKPSPEYLIWLRQSFAPSIPNNFEPQNRYNRDSVRFLKEQKIQAIHNPDESTKEAFLLITNFRARPIVENLLLGRLDAKDIAKKVNSRLGEFITARGIEAYNHYFWNVNLLKVDEWAILLKDYEARKDHTISILQVGPAMALHKSGFQQAIETKVVLKEMMDAVYFDFRDWKAQPMGIMRTKAITHLAKAAVMIDERLSQADSALKESLSAFERFRMQHAESGVKKVGELAPAGNFSNSGAKLLDSGEGKPK